jgi:hypothetical protein
LFEPFFNEVLLILLFVNLSSLLSEVDKQSCVC